MDMIGYREPDGCRRPGIRTGSTIRGLAGGGRLDPFADPRSGDAHPLEVGRRDSDDSREAGVLPGVIQFGRVTRTGVQEGLDPGLVGS